MCTFKHGFDLGLSELLVEFWAKIWTNTTFKLSDIKITYSTLKDIEYG